MREQVLEDTAFYLDILSTYNYSEQHSLVSSLLASHPPPRPLSPRFTIRPMTPHDIPAAAHLLVHAFGDHGVLDIHLRHPVIPYSANINNWIARLRIILCDHCSFVVEDMEFAGDPEMKNCNCQQYTSVDLAWKDEQDEANGAEEKGGRGGGGGGGRGHIASLVMGYDLASRMVNFSVPATYHRMKAIWGLLQKLADKRMERIREMDNKMLTKEEKRVREHREKEAKEEIHPEHMHHLLRSRDSATDSVRTAPISGEGLEVWLLATRATHAGHSLASALSHLIVAYARERTAYRFLAIEAAHPATERIWTHAGIGGCVVARMKTQEYACVDEDGATIFPFASVEYDVCAIDVEIKK